MEILKNNSRPKLNKYLTILKNYAIIFQTVFFLLLTGANRTPRTLAGRGGGLWGGVGSPPPLALFEAAVQLFFDGAGHLTLPSASVG